MARKGHFLYTGGQHMYEIPDALKKLYVHWRDHVSYDPPALHVHLNKKALEGVELFMAERMHIWHKRTTHQEKPYSSDEVLSRYRFCNIYRELDRQTIEIHSILTPLKKDFALWLLNAAFCRFVCNPDTIQKIGFLDFDLKQNQNVYERLKTLPSPKYGTAYVFPISAIQKSMYPTREDFFCSYLPQVIPAIAEIIKKQNRVSVSDILPEIQKTFGFQFKFHWTEILIDVAYQYPQHLNLFKRFPVGPGSLPTMRLLSSGDPEGTILNLVGYTPKGFPYVTYNGQPVLLSAENWEGVGCEYRKYVNLKLGKGRRRKYKNTHENYSESCQIELSRVR